MVNTGKPSTGCYLCRARRIKCDEAKPHCMRCQKSKRDCPGYRDAFELNLRDQTNATKRKVSVAGFDTNTPILKIESYNKNSASRPAKKRATSCPIVPIPVIDPDLPSYEQVRNNRLFLPAPITEAKLPESIVEIIPRQFSSPIDQRAVCFFLSNFVLLPYGRVAKGHLDFLMPLMQHLSNNSTLMLTVNAVALAALGNQPNARKLLPMADSQYVTALNQINKDLQDSKKAKEDSTLAAVFLLSVYEQLSPHPAMGGWVSHLEGAVALLKARGRSGLDTNVGRALFDVIRTHMTVECISNSKEVKEGVDWWTSFASEDTVQYEISVLNLKVADLRAESHKICALGAHSTENISKVLEHLRKAEAIEQEYAKWCENLPKEWQPITKSWIDYIPGQDLQFTTCYPGRVDTYNGLWMATAHNFARASRLFILTTILRCTAWLSPSSDYTRMPEYMVISKQASRLIDDIISSIPFFFGHISQDIKAPCFEKSYFPCGSNSKTTGTGVTGVRAIWPLYAAFTSDFTMNSQRLWLRGRLKYVAEVLGIYQANLILQVKTRYPSTFINRDRIANMYTARMTVDSNILKPTDLATWAV